MMCPSRTGITAGAGSAWSPSAAGGGLGRASRRNLTACGFRSLIGKPALLASVIAFAKRVRFRCYYYARVPWFCQCALFESRSGIVQSISRCPAALNARLIAEKGRLPKKPRLADKGEGWADSITVCLSVSIHFFFFFAGFPHSTKTTGSSF